MKKLIQILCIVAATASTSYAAGNAWGLDASSAGVFYDEDSNIVTNLYNFALVAARNDKDFTTFSLNVGDVISDKTQIGTSDYVTIKQGTLRDVGVGASIVYMDTSWAFDETYLSDCGISEGDEVALLVWNTNSSTMSEGDMYCCVNVQLAGGSTTECGNWVVPSLSQNSVSDVFSLLDSVGGGTIDSKYLTLSSTVTVVPEPSTYAVIFGAIALGFVAYRRRK